jgi:osmotically-inducible protein OsmY
VIDDKKLQQDILDELDWDPSVHAAHIGVAVHNGVATLTGHVGSYLEKHHAEVAASRVKGVKAIAQEIEVQLPSGAERSDEDIAANVLNRFSWLSSLPADCVKIRVEKGVVTLSGDVDWYYQKEAAARTVHEVKGVRSVIDNITIKSSVRPGDVRQRIEQALKRSAEVEASQINVLADNTMITLRGRVHSWHERKIAEQAAWSAPGVTRVQDELSVGS